MKKENYLENMWNMMRGLGQFSEFKNYAEYQSRVLGISKSPKNKKATEFEEWKNGLDEKEKLDFETALGND